MKNINDLIEEVKNNPEFREKFIGLDESDIDKMLKDEGYDVSMEEVAEAAENIDWELTTEELEKVAGGSKSHDDEVVVSGLTYFCVLTGTMCKV